MAKTQTTRVTDTIGVLKPYLDRALTDPKFRDDLRDAMEAARELYGPLTKGNGNVSGAAMKLASDKKAQKQAKRAVEDLQRALTTIQGKKKRKGRGRKMVLLAGVIVGALYNPWTGQQTRDWLLDQIAGSDDLQPLQDLGEQATDVTTDAAGMAEGAAKETVGKVEATAKAVADKAGDGAKA